MKVTLKRTRVLYVLIAMVCAGIVLFVASLAVSGADWASNRANKHIYSNGQTVNAGTIFDRNGVVLAVSSDGKRLFSKNSTIRRATLHIVGDTSGYISTGTHSLYRDKLSGYSFVGGIYKLINDGKGSDVALNIDAKACRIAYNALGSYDGTVAVYNYKTGELLCSVSKPAYDVNNKPGDILTNEKYDGVFLDKAISGLYTPGSVMKIVTAASAIENIPDIYSRTFTCTGKCALKDGTVICNSVHGKVDFKQAFASSCNSAFAQIAAELGTAKLAATAKSLGFNTRIFSGNVRLAMSTVNDKITSESELGWAGIGQSTTLVNPCHLLMIVGSIANSGNGIAPERIKSTGGIFGSLISKKSAGITILPETAARLSELMRASVVDEYGEWHFPDLQMCGKTGTAQLDGGEAAHSWFVGFSQRSDLPLAVVCVAEHAGSGIGTAAVVSNKVLQYFLDEYT